MAKVFCHLFFWHTIKCDNPNSFVSIVTLGKFPDDSPKFPVRYLSNISVRFSFVIKKSKSLGHGIPMNKKKTASLEDGTEGNKESSETEHYQHNRTPRNNYESTKERAAAFRCWQQTILLPSLPYGSASPSAGKLRKRSWRYWRSREIDLLTLPTAIEAT